MTGKRISRIIALAVCLAFTAGCCAAAGEEKQEITPGINAYGWYNRAYFADYNSGIEGAYVEPEYGELITPDGETLYSRWFMEDMARAAVQETAELAGKVFDGEIRGEAGTPARRMFDLYDAAVHRENDAKAEDRIFLEYVAPLIGAQDPQALRDAADTLYLATGIHVLYSITPLQEGSGTNRTLPAVALVAPSYGEKVAYDPVAGEKYGAALQKAMGEFARGIGISADEADVAEAYRLQTAVVRTPTREIRPLYMQKRRERASAESETYSTDACSDDINRIMDLHPATSVDAPEGLNETEAAVWRKRAYLDLHTRITREARDLEGLGEGPGILAALRKAGYTAGPVIVTPDALDALEHNAVTAETLAAWKLNAVIRFAEKAGYAPAACRAAAKAMARAADCAMWGSDTAPEPADEETAARTETADLLKQDAAILWAQEKHYTPEMTEKVREIVEEIRQGYIRQFRANDWLTEEEKQLCITKMERLSAVIGIPTEDNYVFPVIVSRAEGGNWLTNRIALYLRDLRRDLRLVCEAGYDRIYYAQPVGFEERLSMMPNVVNAMANSSCVSVLVPAGIIMAADELAEDDFEFRAVLRFFAGHEIGHLFDSAGSVFDAYGTIRNWWSEESRIRFEASVKQFAAFYDRFEIAKGLHQEFAGDYSEPMADFAGFRVVLDLLGDDAQAQERFFATLSRLFCSVKSRPALEMLTDEFTTDNHPHGPLRVNPLVTSTDSFYELYGIRETDPMYVAPEDRLKLW